MACLPVELFENNVAAKLGWNLQNQNQQRGSNYASNPQIKCKSPIKNKPSIATNKDFSRYPSLDEMDNQDEDANLSLFFDNNSREVNIMLGSGENDFSKQINYVNKHAFEINNGIDGDVSRWYVDKLKTKFKSKNISIQAFNDAKQFYLTVPRVWYMCTNPKCYNLKHRNVDNLVKNRLESDEQLI